MTVEALRRGEPEVLAELLEQHGSETAGSALRPGRERPDRLRPDGRFLAYTFVNATGHVSSHLLDLDSGETRTLGGSSNQAWATFSPDGERIAVVRYALNGTTAQAFIGSAAGDATDFVAMGPEVRNKPGHHGLRIQHLPDGTKLLIVHAAGGGAWITDVATGKCESVALGDDEWVSWRGLAR